MNQFKRKAMEFFVCVPGNIKEEKEQFIPLLYIFLELALGLRSEM